MTERKKVYYAVTADDLQTVGRTSGHSNKIRQAQVPNFGRDVALIVLLFAGLAALGAWSAVELVIKVLDIARPELEASLEDFWFVVPLAASVAGLGALIVRLGLWDKVWEIRPEAPFAMPLEEIEELPDTGKEVVAQVQRPDGAIRYAKFGSFRGWRRSHFQDLAQFLWDNQAGAITRDRLVESGLWKNLTGRGIHHDYLYQDVFGDLAWLGWVVDGRVTDAGLDWANETKPGLMDPPTLR